MARILAIDDEPDLLETERRILSRVGHEVVVAGGGAEGIAAIKAGRFDLVLTDLMMPRVDGLAVLEAAREFDPALPVVLVTAFATVERAVAAMRAGAADYVAKPFDSGTLRHVAERALQHGALRSENRRLRAALSGTPLVGSSAPMRHVAGLIDRVGATDLTVLITGESGTGKEVVARSLHAASARANGPFVAVDCGAIPPSLVESELFGHDKGAFTGAESERRGLVEEAEGGTFFLDEIGDLEAGAQTRLLRLLQEGEFRRVGENRMRKADLRILAATNRDIESRVREGLFREDLLHRLNVVRIHLPPLRDRKDDVVELFTTFVARFRGQAGRGALALSPVLLAKLAAHPWPGNVREVVNIARYVAGLAPGPEADIGDLPPNFGGIAPTTRADGPGVRTDLPYADAKRLWVDSFDATYFERVLELHNGNISAAARAAEIDRKTIQRFLKRAGDE